MQVEKSEFCIRKTSLGVKVVNVEKPNFYIKKWLIIMNILACLK